MPTRNFAALFVLLCGFATSALAQRVESTVSRVPANAETLLTVKATNFRPGWTVSVDGSETRIGPTVFSLRNTSGMVTLNVQNAPRPDGTIGFSTSIPVEVRKFQETVVILKGIPAAGGGTTAAAASKAPVQGPDGLLGTLTNACKAHEVKFEFFFNGKEYKSETVSPGKRRTGVEVLRGTYKVRMFTRPFETNPVAGKALLKCQEEADERRVTARSMHQLRGQEPWIVSEQKACEARASKLMKSGGGHGNFRFRDSEESFAVTEDKWHLSHDCKHDN